MSNLSNAVRVLEDRRAALEAELNHINQRLRSIGVALGTPSAKSSVAKKAPAKPNTTSAVKSTPVKKGATRRWFEPGEAVALMQKLLTKPMRPSEVIKGLAAMKGYGGSKLNKQARDRFTWAATSAMKAALQAKRIVRNSDGSLQAPAAKK